jgi:hypothetical protein
MAVIHQIDIVMPPNDGKESTPLDHTDIDASGNYICSLAGLCASNDSRWHEAPEMTLQEWIESGKCHRLLKGHVLDLILRFALK